MFRRSLTVAVVLAVFTALFGAPSAGACGGGPTAETFEVVTEWGKPTYKAGQTAEVHVTVLRPAPKDPFDLGIEFDPPHQTPVEGAYVVTALAVGVPPAWAVGETGPDGTVHLKIKLRRNLRGDMYASTRASITYNADGPDCTNVEEWGRKIDYPAFTVKKG